MSDDERSLYDDVTEYLLEPSLVRVPRQQRRLLLIGFHRRMASSIPALAASLENVAARLRRLRCRRSAPTMRRRDVILRRSRGRRRRSTRPPRTPPDPRSDREAGDRRGAGACRGLRRARAIAADTTQGALASQDAIRRRPGSWPRRPRQRQGRGVHRVDHDAGVPARAAARHAASATSDVTLFRGDNDHDRAQQAHARWLEEEGRNLPPGTRPSREVAVRLALVHEFRTRSQGPHLHRGRREGPEPPVLRHGHQLRPAVEPAAHRAAHRPLPPLQPAARRHRRQLHRAATTRRSSLTFEILSQKLDLFGTVLDASDAGAARPRTTAPRDRSSAALGAEFESDLRSIYSRSRTLDEVDARDARAPGQDRRSASEFERAAQARPQDVIESRFDEDVRAGCSGASSEELPARARRVGSRPRRLVVTAISTRRPAPIHAIELDGTGAVFELADPSPLPARCRIGARRLRSAAPPGSPYAQPLNLGHPLVSRRGSHERRRTWPASSVESGVRRRRMVTLARPSRSDRRLICVDYRPDSSRVERLVAGGLLDGGDAPLIRRCRRARILDAEHGAICRRRRLQRRRGRAGRCGRRAAVPSTSARSRRASSRTSSGRSGSSSDSSTDKVLVCRREQRDADELRAAPRPGRDAMARSARAARRGRGGDRCV